MYNDFFKLNTILLYDEKYTLLEAIKLKKVQELEFELNNDDFYNMRDAMNLIHSTLETSSTLSPHNITYDWSFYGINIEDICTILMKFIPMDSERDWCSVSLFWALLNCLEEHCSCLFNHQDKIFSVKELEENNLEDLMKKFFENQFLILNNNFFIFIETIKDMSLQEICEYSNVERDKMKIIEKIERF
jgi:hypothetical protein